MTLIFEIAAGILGCWNPLSSPETRRSAAVIILGTMPNFFQLGIEFSCPSCGKRNRLEVVTENKSADTAEAVKAAPVIPLKCANCTHLAPKGTGMRVLARAISAAQYAAWIQANQTRLHIHTDRSPKN